MIILQHDETETGPRIRRTLADKINVACTLVASDIGGTITRDNTVPAIDLYSYIRPSTGEMVWLIEARIFFPPDVELFRGWVVDTEPTRDQVREIVATNRQAGDVI